MHASVTAAAGSLVCEASQLSVLVQRAYWFSAHGSRAAGRRIDPVGDPVLAGEPVRPVLPACAEKVPLPTPMIRRAAVAPVTPMEPKHEDTRTRHDECARHQQAGQPQRPTLTITGVTATMPAPCTPSTSPADPTPHVSQASPIDGHRRYAFAPLTGARAGQGVPRGPRRDTLGRKGDARAFGA